MDNLSPKVIKKLRRIRLIATDLDGTLLNNDGQISDVTRETVRKLKGLGMWLAIMTARAHSSAERIADELEMKSPIISLDGGLIRLPHTSENIFASYIKPSVVRTVILEAEKRFSSVALFVDDKMMRLESDTMLPSYIDSLELDTIVVEDLLPFSKRTIQVIVGADSKSIIKSIARKAVGLFSGVNVNVYRSSQHGDRWYLEIKNKRYSKATGLAHLEKYFRIRKDEVAVLGDFKNDLEAFKHAGIGVAMKNAVWELKEQAMFVTQGTNDEDGASEFFELIFKMRTNNRH
jgi:Cof subfamily protein (haloacid dehalogenase superfamily)